MPLAFQLNRPLDEDLISISAEIIRENFRALLQDKFRVGIGAPTNSAMDFDGYFYLDVNSAKLYKRVSGSWDISGAFDLAHAVTNNIKLEDLSNLNFSGVADHDIIYYDAGSGKWKNGTIKNILGNRIDINMISGFSISGTPNKYDIIMYNHDNGGKWKNVSSSVLANNISLNDIKDIEVSGATNGQYLYYDATTGKWKPKTIPTPTAYTASKGITLTTSNDFQHTNNITAGSAGPTSNTTGNTTIKIPYVAYDANGHITSTATRTHTIGMASTSAAGLVKLSGDFTTDASGNLKSTGVTDVTSTWNGTTGTGEIKVTKNGTTTALKVTAVYG